MNPLLETTPNETAETFRDLEVKELVRIMVVEDDFCLRHFVVQALVRSGYEVDEAENGIRAWKALHLKRYDLLITDNEMPGMTGLQLVHKLRSARFELPVIFASGSLPADLRVKYPWLRIAAMLPKPFTLGDLIRAVRGILPQDTADFHTNLGQPLSDQVFCQRSPDKISNTY